MLKSEIREIRVGHKESLLEVAKQYIDEMEETGERILRWGLLNFSGNTAIIEVAVISSELVTPNINKGIEREEFSAFPHISGTCVAMIVPTGVGAEIGGFAGDASPVAKALSAVVDTVIVHPNVVNASDFYGGNASTLYLDGFTLDNFLLQKVQLGKKQISRIGLILDKLDEEAESHLLNAANGLAASQGIDIIGYKVCAEKVQVKTSRTPLGHFVGSIENPEVFLQAADDFKLQGANAIAIVTAIAGVTDDDLSSHYKGISPNPVGAVEALISRSITLKTGLPCAHAPAFTHGLGKTTKVIDPRAASEVASGSGLPCILIGLSQTPTIVKRGGIGAKDLTAIIVPYGCAGGIPSYASRKFNIPLIAVRENSCVVGISADRLKEKSFVCVDNYTDAIAFLACKKANVNWNSIKRPFSKIPRI